MSGAGGTGKTYVYNAILGALALQRIAVAWTGIAASLLYGGRTVHSYFKLPVLAISTPISRLTLRSQEAQYLKNAKVIVWDEVSMSTRVVFDLVDRSMQDICQEKDKPFCG